MGTVDLQKEPLIDQNVLLRRTEEDLHAILNATTESVFILDLNENVVLMNEVAAKRLGSTIKELLGTRLYDKVPAEIATSRRAQVAEVVASRKAKRFVDKRWDRVIDQTVFPIQDETGEVVRVAIFAEDITERVIAE